MEKEKIRKRRSIVNVVFGVIAIVIGILYLCAGGHMFECSTSLWLGALLFNFAEHEADISNLEKRIEELEEERSH